MKIIDLNEHDPVCILLGGSDVYVIAKDNAEGVRRVVIVFDSGGIDGTIQKVLSMAEARALSIAILKAAEG